MAVEREVTEKQKTGSVGRKGPLANFCKGHRNGGTKIIPEDGLDTNKPSTRAKQKNKRSRGSKGSKRRDSRKSTEANSPERDQTTQSGCPHGSTDNNDCNDPTQDTLALGVSACIKCGHPVKFTNENRCEDCFAEDQHTYHGNSLNCILSKSPW